MTVTVDVVVVGAGIVGLASAREILARHPGLRLVVVEKEAAVGAHQSGHNSGVVHSGLYYAPGSLKARLCSTGAVAMYAYCQARGVPTERCGKLVVATRAEELARLAQLLERGRANGVPGLEMVGPERIAELEPHCAGLGAIWSPGTGIVDYTLVTRSLADDVTGRGGELRLACTVLGFDRRADGTVVRTDGDDLVARRVLTCAGLYADRLARFSGASTDPVIVPFRGDYYELRPERRHLVRNLVYPAPDPGLPFLGVHATRRLRDGAVLLGPNAVLAFAREGYRRRTLRPGELARTIGNAGFRRFARAQWRTGAAELYRDLSKGAFVKACQRLIPELEVGDVVAGGSGVRAQALGRDGRLVEDFVVDVQGRQLMHVRNAPSPAATSSLEIARLVADRFDGAA